MSSIGYHEPVEELSEESRTTSARAPVVAEFPCEAVIGKHLDGEQSAQGFGTQ